MTLTVTKKEKTKTISQVIEEGGFSFNAMPLKSFVNKTITVYGYKVIESKKYKHPYFILDVASGNKRFKVACGAKVIMDKIKTLEQYFPFQAKVIKQKRYYDLI